MTHRLLPILAVLICPVCRAAAADTAADYTREVRRIRGLMPDGFSLVQTPPFIVVGDEPPAMVRRRAERTVAWAVRMLKKAYFKKDPDDVITVWLFKDRKSYRHHAKLLFNNRPDTPFGYYSSHHKALVMNIATGGGTLVHEIVHPFVAANFPRCPAWFNEGLGSLYEQCGRRDGCIVGFTNWRLAGLQKSIKAGDLPSFKTLTHTTTHQFYNQDPGTNYAQARYLCYYLQEHGLLRKYYRLFHKRAAKDATGYTTLQRVLGQTDMTAFQQQWEEWVLELRVGR